MRRIDHLLMEGWISGSDLQRAENWRRYDLVRRYVYENASSHDCMPIHCRVAGITYYRWLRLPAPAHQCTSTKITVTNAVSMREAAE